MKPPPADPAPSLEPASRVDCPDCGGPASRVPRRLIDRLQSLVRPVQRYRCRSFACQWVGNIPVKGGGTEPTDRPPL